MESVNAIEVWSFDKAITETEDYKLNNRIALEVSDKGFDIISDKYTHISPSSIKYVLMLD